MLWRTPKLFKSSHLGTIYEVASKLNSSLGSQIRQPNESLRRVLSLRSPQVGSSQGTASAGSNSCPATRMRPRSPVRPRWGTPNTGCINDRFPYTIDGQFFFHQSLVESHGAKGGEAQPCCNQTKGLANMPRIDHHRAVSGGIRILTLGARKNSGHQHERCGWRVPPLISKEVHDVTRTRVSLQEFEAVVVGSIGIDAAGQAIHIDRQYVDFDRMTRTSGRRSLQSNTSDSREIDPPLHTPGQAEQSCKVIQPDPALRETPPRPPCKENRRECALLPWRRKCNLWGTGVVLNGRWRRCFLCSLQVPPTYERQV